MDAISTKMFGVLEQLDSELLSESAIKRPVCHYYGSNNYSNIQTNNHFTTFQLLKYGTAQRQRCKCTQLFCDLRVRIECNECILSMRTSLDLRIL